MAPSQICRRNSHLRSAASSMAVGAGPEAVFAAETHGLDSSPVTSSPIREARGRTCSSAQPGWKRASAGLPPPAWRCWGGSGSGPVRSGTVSTGSEDPSDLPGEAQTSSRASAPEDRRRHRVTHGLGLSGAGFPGTRTEQLVPFPPGRTHGSRCEEAGRLCASRSCHWLWAPRRAPSTFSRRHLRPGPAPT